METAINNEFNNIKALMSMVTVALRMGDYNEAVKFGASASTAAYGTEYQEIVTNFLANTLTE